MPNNGPIFIGGCGSSGTTLLRKILNAHSRIAIGEEMSIFDRPTIYHLPYSDLKEAIRTNDFMKFEKGQVFNVRFQDGRTYCGLARHGNGPTHYHDHETVLKVLEDFDQTDEFLDWYFSTSMADQGKKRWGEKTPNNIFCAAQALAMFSGSKFVHVLRDGRDVCLSLVERRGYHPYIAVYRWIACMNAGLALLDQPDVMKNYFEVSYESLVREPELTVKSLCRFLGEDFEETMLTDFVEYGKVFDEDGMAYAKSDITDRRVGKWKTADQKLVRVIEAGCWPYLYGLGFNMEGSDYDGKKAIKNCKNPL